MNEKDCPLGDSKKACGLSSEGCEFKHTCQQMMEDYNRNLLKRLKDVEGLIRYYEAAEGNWAQETDARQRAYAEYHVVLVECKQRGLI